MDTKEMLSQKDLERRWGVCNRTVRRRTREFGLVPKDYTGLMPLFTPEAVERMEARRKSALDKASGRAAVPSTGGIISVKEAKRLAGRGRGRK